MYHYVREYDGSVPYFRYLSVDNFRKQLEYFGAEFGYVSFGEWHDFVCHGAMPEQSGKIVLTFDDGVRCHYDHVFPELLRQGLWGIFYVATAPYSDSIILDVHRIHLLCGSFLGTELLTIARSLVSEDMILHERVEEFRNQTYSRQHNGAGVSEFKRLMNYYIDTDYRTAFISKLAKYLGFSFQPEMFYVSSQQLSEMNQRGMIIGSHSHTHPVMSNLRASNQRSEIERSFSLLGELVKANHKTYCHPYGGFHSFNSDTVDTLKDLDVCYAFNVESREINQDDYEISKYALPRYDCNYFPHGQSS